MTIFNVVFDFVMYEVLDDVIQIRCPRNMNYFKKGCVIVNHVLHIKMLKSSTTNILG